MPQTTTLRRLSTLVVSALFAVVFVCSGASAAQAVSTHGPSSVGAHTVTSKAAVRAVESTHHGVNNQAPAPLDLAATGPADTDNSPAFVVAAASETPAANNAYTHFTISERAPPTL